MLDAYPSSSGSLRSLAVCPISIHPATRSSEGPLEGSWRGLASSTSSSGVKWISCSLRASSTFSLNEVGVRKKLHTAMPAKERSMASEPGRIASMTGRERGGGSMKDVSPPSPKSS